ncbi:MAG: hypothetical protein WC045_02510 [Patescibacteria group bacterium]
MKDEPVFSVYVAGSLFTLFERMGNITFAQLIKGFIQGELERRGSNLVCQVILPQEEAKTLIKDGKLDLEAVVANCIHHAKTVTVMVASGDGPDCDSGTCIEIGVRHGYDPKLPIVLYRTDFRGSEENGMNAMLKICGEPVMVPSFGEDLHQLVQAIAKVAVERGLAFLNAQAA